MSHFLLGPRQKGVPSLKDIASRVLTLSANRQLIGNVGGLPMELIRPILVHFSPTELARVEDVTWEQSGLDITCDTWPLWQKHCRTTHGEPNVSEVDPLDLDCEGELPDDAGDYRTYFYKKEKLLEERRRETAQRARSIMENNRQQKEKNKVKVIDTFTPKKRRNASRGFQQSISAPKSSGEFYKSLGISTKKTRFHRKAISVPPTATVMNRPAKLTSSATDRIHGLQTSPKVPNSRPLPQAALRRTAVAPTRQTPINKKAAHSLFAQRDLHRADPSNNVQTTARGTRVPVGQNRTVSRSQQAMPRFSKTSTQSHVSTSGKDVSHLAFAKQNLRPSITGGQNPLKKRRGELLSGPNTKLVRRS